LEFLFDDNNNSAFNVILLEITFDMLNGILVIIRFDHRNMSKMETIPVTNIVEIKNHPHPELIIFKELEGYRHSTLDPSNNNLLSFCNILPKTT